MVFYSSLQTCLRLRTVFALVLAIILIFSISLFSSISRADVEATNALINEYHARDLLHPDDKPWGQTYPSRVWCSVLTMWPERRQNIEVELIICSVAMNVDALDSDGDVGSAVRPNRVLCG